VILNPELLRGCLPSLYLSVLTHRSLSLAARQATPDAVADAVADVVADVVVDVVVPNQPVADADVADSRGDGQPLRPWRREPWTRFGPSPLNKWEATQIMRC
jgi:hypothetical protein